MKPFWKRRQQRSLPLTRVLTAVALTTIGLSLYWLVRRRVAVPIKSDEIEVPAAQAMPFGIPTSALASETPMQLLFEGVGPLYIRSYVVDIIGAQRDRKTLMQHIMSKPNDFSPSEMSYFEKTKGEEGHLEVGDEFFIHIVGPWNGPVRAINVTETSFAFVTLEGHLEAGQITFSLEEHPEREDVVRFRIQSWARSSDRITDFFYRFFPVSRFAQTTMWAYFCERVVEHSGGEMLDKIQIMTHRANVENILRELPPHKRYTPYFTRFSDEQLNFDISKTEEFTEAYGWKLDDYSTGLPNEHPGPPEPHGSFVIAKDIVMHYEFPDPALISGVFVPDVALENRLMVLRAHFLFFTFYFGVRIGKVIDEVREVEKNGPLHAWGYSYRTLKGHFEMGEITFEVWKYEETGEVRFHVHAYSKPDRIANPFYRLGFNLFGRQLQRRFARTSLARMQQLVLERLTKQENIEEPIETPEVQPIASDEAAQEAVEAVEDVVQPLDTHEAEQASESAENAPHT